MTAPADDDVLAARLRELAAAPVLLVVVDFDGTLAPIVTDPADAHPLADAVEALAVLAALPGTEVAVVSGRSLPDLVVRAGTPPAVRLVGSHGAEHTPGEVEGLDHDALERREQLRSDVLELVGHVPGVRLEDKLTGVAVHVREAARDDARTVLSAVREGPASAPGIHATAGHEVLELSVVETGKGRALEALRAASGATAVLAAGDDVTDESMFELLGTADVGIKVGPGPTAAGHRVPDPEALAAVLTALATARTT